MKLQVCLGEQGKGKSPLHHLHSINPIWGEYLCIPSTLHSAFTSCTPGWDFAWRGLSPPRWISSPSHTAAPGLECFSKHHLFSQTSISMSLRRHHPSQRKRLEMSTGGWVSSPCCCPRKCHHGWTFCFHFHHLSHFPDSPIHPSDINSKIISNSQHTGTTQIKTVFSTCSKAFQKDSCFLV